MIHNTIGTYRRFSSHKTEADIVQWDYGSWPDALPKKDGANALSGAGSLDTATTHLNSTSRTKNLRIEVKVPENHPPITGGFIVDFPGRLREVLLSPKSQRLPCVDSQ